MPWGSVRVLGPAGRDVYIKDSYEEPLGSTGEAFPVEYGPNTFVTLDQQFRVDFEVSVLVDDDHRHIEATLVPVDPPRPTVLTPAPSPNPGGR